MSEPDQETDFEVEYHHAVEMWTHWAKKAEAAEAKIAAVSANPVAFLAAVRAEHVNCQTEPHLTCWAMDDWYDGPCYTELLARAVEAVLVLNSHEIWRAVESVHHRDVDAVMKIVRAAITDALEGTDDAR